MLNDKCEQKAEITERKGYASLWNGYTMSASNQDLLLPPSPHHNLSLNLRLELVQLETKSLEHTFMKESILK